MRLVQERGIEGAIAQLEAWGLRPCPVQQAARTIAEHGARAVYDQGQTSNSVGHALAQLVSIGPRVPGTAPEVIYRRTRSRGDAQ
jgi:hypothetical protein